MSKVKERLEDLDWDRVVMRADPTPDIYKIDTYFGDYRAFSRKEIAEEKNCVTQRLESYIAHCREQAALVEALIRHLESDEFEKEVEAERRAEEEKRLEEAARKKAEKRRQEHASRLSAIRDCLIKSLDELGPLASMCRVYTAGDCGDYQKIYTKGNELCEKVSETIFFDEEINVEAVTQKLHELASTPGMRMLSPPNFSNDEVKVLFECFIATRGVSDDDE